MIFRFRIALCLGTLIALFVYGFALAATITVDGNPADWLPASVVAQTITNTGATVPAEVSIQDVYFTNDTSKLFFRLETVAATDWSQAGIVAICLSTEAAADAAFGPCTSDYTLVLDTLMGTATLVNNSGSLPDTTTGIEVAVSGTTTEISILLSKVNITSANCSTGCSISSQIIVDASVYDGGLGVDYTNTAFTDGLLVGSGSPTAVGITFTARVSALEEKTNWLPLWFGFGVALVLVGFFLLKRVRFNR